MPIGATIGGIGAAIGGIGSIWGASSAADAQRDAANRAQALAQQQMQLNEQNFAPWISGGQNAFNTVQRLTGTNVGGDPLTAALTSRFQPTMAQLEQTPGYQFVLGQGLKSTQNSYASKGLGSSGAAMKGAADYATGLASNTYQQMFNNYWGENKNIYDMLTGQSNAGISAAGGVTGANTNLTNSSMNAEIGAGNAQAAMYNSIGPSLSNMFTGIGNAYNNYQGYNLLSGYLNNRTNGTTAAPWQSDPRFAGIGGSSYEGPVNSGLWSA